MTALAPFLILVWMLVMLAAFPSFSSPRRAILFVMFSGTLFLPEALSEHIALGPFHFSKYHAISYAMLLGALLFDSERLFSGTPRWVDVPMMAWCLCPLPSVLTNAPPPDGSSSLRDALSQTWGQTVSYGIPYLIGRTYFCDKSAMRDLAYSMVIAAFVYIPFCLYEIRMSPQLHNMVFGYSQHSFEQTIRFGGYRPMVFLQHGLALAMFMVAASLVGVWMWRSGGLYPSTGADAGASRKNGYLLLLLVATTVLLKSTGALVLGIAGGFVLWLGRTTGSRLWLLSLVALPPLYVAVRATGAWTGESLVEAVSEYIEADRAESLEFRLVNENLLVQKALERPVFGWGGWGRSRVFDEDSGKDQTVKDGLWIIALGDRGIVGLSVLGVALLLPVIRFAIHFPPSSWSRPDIAPIAACSVVLALWCIDSLMNAMILPIYLVIAGALTGLTFSRNTESDN